MSDCVGCHISYQLLTILAKMIKCNLYFIDIPGGGGGGGPVFKPEKARKEFPETWLWTEKVAAPNGETIIQAQVPDSMTTWVASAFALHPIQVRGFLICLIL